MPDSTHPLTDYEWKLVRESLPSYRPGFLKYNDFDPTRVVLFLARTGAHPVVLANPRMYGLRLERVEKGWTVIWTQPKNHKGNREARVPLLDPEVCSWVEEFVQGLYEHRVPLSTMARAVRDVGKHAHVVLSPRSLRHTFLAYVANKTRNPAAVALLGSIPLSMARKYVNPTSIEEFRHCFEEKAAVGQEGR